MLNVVVLVVASMALPAMETAPVPVPVQAHEAMHEAVLLTPVGEDVAVPAVVSVPLHHTPRVMERIVIQGALKASLVGGVSQPQVRVITDLRASTSRAAVLEPPASDPSSSVLESLEDEEDSSSLAVCFADSEEEIEPLNVGDNVEALEAPVAADLPVETVVVVDNGGSREEILDDPPIPSARGPPRSPLSVEKASRSGL